jgi:protein-S-isoprenylcysteine O-methyltransferase Ste14
MTGTLLVGAQMALLAGLAAAPLVADSWPAPPWVRLCGLIVAAAGAGLCLAAFPQLGRALTPLPEPRADAELTTSGLYRWMRHPIYSGVLSLAWGWTLVVPSTWPVVLSVVLTLLLNVKARYEESLLVARYPQYPGYAARTPRFVPRPWTQR